MTLYEGFQAYAKKQNFPFVTVTGDDGATLVPVFQYDGENGQYQGRAICSEQERLMVIAADLNVRVRKEDLDRAARYLCRLNFPLKLGGFYLDDKTGDIMVRVPQLIGDIDPETQLAMIERSVLTCGFLADANYREIAKEFL